VSTDSPSTPLLSVQNLETAFRDELGDWLPIVRGVSFDVGAHETVALVGESGSGKSVTALSIMRLLERSMARCTGRVMFAGQDLLGLATEKMQKIRGNDVSMIFQEPMTSLNPVLTIGDQLTEALTWHRGMSQGEAETEALRLLDKVRIPAARERLGDYPHRFSGGMRQRVMIAMALACKPKLLIADEPTTALDVTIQAQILDLLKTLQAEEQMSMLFITHDMGVVAEIADRTIVMRQGEIVEACTTVDVFARPQHPYTKALLMAVPRLGSMGESALPMRFPLVDLATGTASVPRPGLPPAADEPPVLEVRNLTTQFDVRGGLLGRPVAAVRAVENVSFDLMAGEVLGVVGESGCGKSTMARSILQLAKPRSGSVKVNGREVMRLGGTTLRQVRRNVQMIFQDPFASLNPRITVGKSIAEPLIVHGIASARDARDRVADLLQRVGLSPDLARRYPHEFSGGQKQRICIARALAPSPSVIVADEAVSALDVSIKAQVINLMLDLQESLGIAYLFISHDMAVVERISHRVAVMYAGEIVEIGPRVAIFDNPQHPYTRRLLAAVPVPEPGHRREIRHLGTDELVSTVRPLDYVPPQRRYREVSPGHLVHETN
jgi:peptide/nickel transport system ATP-binding protein